MSILVIGVLYMIKKFPNLLYRLPPKNLYSLYRFAFTCKNADEFEDIFPNLNHARNEEEKEPINENRPLNLLRQPNYIVNSSARSSIPPD